MIWIINESLEIYIIYSPVCNILACKNYTTNIDYICNLDVEYLDIGLLQRSISDSIENNTIMIKETNEDNSIAH